MYGPAQRSTSVLVLLVFAWSSTVATGEWIAARDTEASESHADAAIIV